MKPPLESSPLLQTAVLSGDTTPCKVIPIILHAAVPNSGHPTRGCLPLWSSYTGLYPQILRKPACLKTPGGPQQNLRGIGRRWSH